MASICKWVEHSAIPFYPQLPFLSCQFSQHPGFTFLAPVVRIHILRDPKSGQLPEVGEIVILFLTVNGQRDSAKWILRCVSKYGHPIVIITISAKRYLHHVFR